MRNYFREAIRQEVQQEVRYEAGQQARHDGQRDTSPHERGPEFRVVLRPIASSLPLGPPGALSLPLAVFLLTLTAPMLRWPPSRSTAGSRCCSRKARSAWCCRSAGAAGRAPRWRAASRTRCARLSRSPECGASCDSWCESRITYRWFSPTGPG